MLLLQTAALCTHGYKLFEHNRSLCVCVFLWMYVWRVYCGSTLYCVLRSLSLLLLTAFTNLAICAINTDARTDV